MTVGLVAPLFGFWYASQVVAGAESILSEQGYDLLVHAVDTPENRRRFLTRAASLRGRVDGLILVDFFAAPQQASRLQSIRKPGVTLGERIDGFSSITIDNRGAAETAVRYLLGLGHRRIALITGPVYHGHHSPVVVERRAGYTAALVAAGVEPAASWIADGGFSVAGGAAAAENVLAAADPPTAIFCLSDEMAMGAIRRARELGTRVPEDLSVVGFDDHDLAAPFGLTTMRQPVREMGRRATRHLLDSIADAGETHETAAVDLVVRDSTAPLRV